MKHEIYDETLKLRICLLLEEPVSAINETLESYGEKEPVNEELLSTADAMMDVRNSVILVIVPAFKGYAHFASVVAHEFVHVIQRIKDRLGYEYAGMNEYEAYMMERYVRESMDAAMDYCSERDRLHAAFTADHYLKAVLSSKLKCIDEDRKLIEEDRERYKEKRNWESIGQATT